jgi:hypothetical protein
MTNMSALVGRLSISKTSPSGSMANDADRTVRRRFCDQEPWSTGFRSRVTSTEIF